MNGNDFLQTSLPLIVLLLLFFSGLGLSQAETYYQYVDKNGTVVITQNRDDVPEDQRETMEEVHFSARPGVADEERITALKEIVNEENIQAIGEKNLRRGKDWFSSFLGDRKILWIAYGVTGFAGFFLLSKLLKNMAGGFVSKIAIKISIIIVIFSGIYLLYLSWLNNTVLRFNQPGDFSEQGLADQITTPQEILEQTQEVVDQFNNNAAQRELILNGMDGG